MKYHRFIYVVLLITCTQVNFSQVKIFTVKSLGIKIGTLEACKVNKNQIDVYIVHSSIDIMTIKADVNTEAIYQNDMLIKSVVSSTINGQSYISQTLWKKDHYEMDCHTRKYNYKDTTYTQPINWSAGKLYFEIPTKGVKVYTETYGKVGILEETPKNGFKMTTPESKQIYYYDDAYTRLLKIEVINNIKNFEMIPYQ